MPTINVDALDAHHLQSVADVLASSKKVIVVTGAGISTSCGIPDFRSKDGLYNMIPNDTELDSATATPPSSQSDFSTIIPDQNPSSSESTPSTPSRRKSSIANLKGQDLFNSSVWADPMKTVIFYKFITSLRRSIRDVKAASPTHKFIRALRDGGRLLRCYTQNVDGFETREGLCNDLSRGKGNKRRFMKTVLERPRPSSPTVPADDCDGGCEVVQLHGDLEYLRCSLCMKLYPWEDGEQGGHEEILLSGVAPKCMACAEKSGKRQEKGKRGTAVGGLRPNIVLYGEEHPQNQLLSPITEYDLGQHPDALIIMGTSLKVHGLKKLVKEFAKAVHSTGKGRGKVIFINREKPPESTWNDVIDYYIQMDTDNWVADVRQRREDLWLRQGELRVQVAKRKAVKRKTEDASVQDDTGKVVKKPKVDTNEGQQETPNPSMKDRKGQGGDPGTNSEYKKPGSSGLSSGRPKKGKSRAKKEDTPVLPTAPSNRPEGLLTPPPSRDRTSKKRGWEDALPDVETPPKRNRLRLSRPKGLVWKDEEGPSSAHRPISANEPTAGSKVLEPKAKTGGNLVIPPRQEVKKIDEVGDGSSQRQVVGVQP